MFTEPCAAYEDRLSDVLAGTADVSSRADWDAHRATCADCDQAFRTAEAALQLAISHPPRMPDEAYWEAYTDRLMARIDREDRPARRLAVLRPAVRRLFNHTGARIAAGIAILVIGIVIGRLPFGNDSSTPDAGLPTGEGGLMRASLDARTLRYLDRSNVLLMGLANFDAAEEAPAGINLSARQDLARTLLEESRELNDALSPSDRLMLSALMDDLERVLLQIANLEASVDLPSIELVQRGVDQNALLMKINLAKMRVVEAAVSSPPDAARDPL